MLLTITLSACNTRTVYNSYAHTPIGGWEKNDALSFGIPPVKQGGEYREDIGLRINNAFPFMSLCIIVEQTVFPSEITYSDTLNCHLINENGEARGHGISHYQYSFHLTNLNLQQGDSIHVTVKHNMKREILPGIADLGVKLSKN